MLLRLVVGVFLATQLLYLLVNLAMVLFLYTNPRAEVTTSDLERVRALTGEDSEAGRAAATAFPAESALGQLPTSRVPDWLDDSAAHDPFQRELHVLLPVFREQPSVLIETLENIYAQEYPDDRIHTYVVYEREDPTVPALIDAIDDWNSAGRDVATLGVNHDALAFDRAPGNWIFSGSRVNRTKAAALTYAFMVLSFDSEDVVTVFDSDTTVPTDTFPLAIAGLTDYDIVQAKQTVRNLEDGLLPTLEAMGIAAWSDIAYARTTHGPYQLLGKAYFMEANVLHTLDEWDVDAVTEDLSLGLAASARGYRLGILDRYVQDTCPSRFRDWITQKRRWVRGPYNKLSLPGWGLQDRLQFWTATIANQSISVTNVVGVPVGILFFALFLTGNQPPIPPLFRGVIAVNGLAWLYYSGMTYAATSAAVEFDNRRQKLLFYLVSNPLTQAVYAALWAIPIVLALRDHLTGRTATFEVTPKR